MKSKTKSSESPESTAVNESAPDIKAKKPYIKPAEAEQSVSGPPATKARGRKQDAKLSDSISQGLGKAAQKKRGWRDIEALTERARLKSLLSDIWHEDIDLDSDIFGETDHLSGYYTDKDEPIEVEPEEDEEWEEFEEDED